MGGERGQFNGNEHVDDEIDLLAADSTRFLGGESEFGAGSVNGPEEVLNVRREGTGIPCGWGAELSVLKRDTLAVDCRGGRRIAVES